jgi:hypothetical protein
MQLEARLEVYIFQPFLDIMSALYNEHFCECTQKCSWLRHYATGWKVAGSSPDEVDFFLIDLILPAALWP